LEGLVTHTILSPHTLVLLRLVVGVVFFLHGLPKWSSLAGTAQFFASLGIPAAGIMAPWVAFVESVGGLALIVGVFTRYAGILLAIDMLVAMVAFKFPKVGFIAPPNQPGVGAELDILLFAGSLVLAAFGPGPFSVDRLLARRKS
jgi:putative oxidoreductase